MRFTIATVFTTLAIGAIAAPGALPAGPGFGDITVGQAGDRCGENLELNCCNEVRQSGDDIDYADGILSGLLADGLLTEGLGLFKGCSKLTVTALIGVDDLLNSQCKQNVACCQGTSQSQDGLVNVGLPCVALGSVL